MKITDKMRLDWFQKNVDGSLFHIHGFNGGRWNAREYVGGEDRSHEMKTVRQAIDAAIHAEKKR